jgi:hypothetical protein
MSVDVCPPMSAKANLVYPLELKLTVSGIGSFAILK